MRLILICSYQDLNLNFAKRKDIEFTIQHADSIRKTFPYVDEIGFVFPYQYDIAFDVRHRAFAIQRTLTPSALNMYLIHNNLNLMSGMIAALDPCTFEQIDDLTFEQIDEVVFDF